MSMWQLRSNKHRAGYLLIVVGLVFIAIAATEFIRTVYSIPRPPAGVLVSRNAPSSIRPSKQSIANYTVPATHPKYIAIPSIGVGVTQVIKLGLTNTHSIAVPNNVYNTGWYDGSSAPGQPGAMFIYGHVSSWSAKGVFYNLKKLIPGSSINVTTGNNTVYTYKVITSKVYPYNDVPMRTVLASYEPKVPGLNLMTCTGKIIKGTSQFSERLVVYTSLVKN